MKFLLTFLFLLIFPLTVHAGILPPCTSTGNCGVCDFLFTINAIMRWIVVVSGSAALLFFVWAGVLFLTSGGSSGQISKAKKILTNTLIGVVIVFSAWTLINFIISEVTTKFNSPLFTGDQANKWYELCVSQGNGCVGKGDGYPCGSCEGCEPREGHCENGQCVAGSACDWLANQTGYKGFGYKCTNISDKENECGLKTYDECDTSANCIKGLCSGGTETVCCYKK